VLALADVSNELHEQPIHEDTENGTNLFHKHLNDSYFDIQADTVEKVPKPKVQQYKMT
jgi:hypothetical protein